MDKAYLSGTDVKITVPFQYGGMPIVPISLSYRVLNQAESVLVAETTLTIVNNATSVDITVPSNINTITSDATREMRIVEVYFNDGTGKFKTEFTYIIEKESVLIEGVNSFQTYANALMKSFELTKLDSWHLASKEERIVALIEARRNMSSIVFRRVYADGDMTRVDGRYSIHDITNLTPTQFTQLPDDFKQTLCRAQVIQANYLLSENDIDALRESGVISKQVGESKESYKTTKSLTQPLCKRAMSELSKWIVRMNIRISR